MSKHSADQARIREASHLQYILEQLDLMADDEGQDVVTLTAIRFKLDADGGTSVLAILTGYKGDEDLVSFVGGFSLKACLLAIGKKLDRKRLSWRRSIPWEERDG